MNWRDTQFFCLGGNVTASFITLLFLYLEIGSVFERFTLIITVLLMYGSIALMGVKKK